MEDFNALALALSGAIGQLRACLILSRDGLVLGAHPVSAEQDAKHAWIRLAALGELERGFVQFGIETWCYVRRGPYAALAVTSPAARPGLVIDQMEEALLEAEQAHAAREGLHQPEPGTAPTSKPRSPLHPELRPLDRPLVLERASSEPMPSLGVVSEGLEVAGLAPLEPSSVDRPIEPTPPSPDGAAAEVPPGPEIVVPEGPRPWEELGSPHDSSGAFDAIEAIVEPETGELGPPPDPASTDPGAPDPPDEGAETADGPGGQDAGEVDPFTLAREFSALLQDDRNPADG